MKKLSLILLFDVDGTLIKSGGAGKKAMEEAFQEIFNIKNGMEKISFAGSTDLGIFKSANDIHQLGDIEHLEPQFRKNYVSRLEKNLKTDLEGQEILPGVESFLDFCKDKSEIYLGLVTGNYKQGSHTKLSHYNLHHYFDEGAFGCDHADRNLLPKIALDRIEEQGYQLPSKDKIWIIGDTVKDVQCAKYNDLNSWIVFTGFSTREDILRENPTRTSETLEDYPSFLAEQF